MKVHKSCLWGILLLLILCSACEPGVSTVPPGTATPTPTLVVSPTHTQPPADPADIIFYNGTLITIEDSQPLAEALAVRNGLIQAVGTNVDILALQGPATTLVDLGGLTLLPGFIDGHTHVLAFSDRMGFSLDEAQETALRYGFTTVNEMWADDGYSNTLLQAEQEGRMRMRANLFAIYNEGILDENLLKIIVQAWYPANDPILDPTSRVRIPGIKIFVDGAFTPGRGCWALSEPILPGAPILSSGICGTQRGDLYWQQDELNQVVLDAQEAGYRVSFHAMGDQAIETALNAIQFARQNTTDYKDARHQIQHNSLVRPDQMPRYEQLNVLASVRGYGDFCDPEGGMVAFGPDRYTWYGNRYALPGLDIHAYLETDYGWTVDPDDRFVQRNLDPIMSLYGLVTHRFVTAQDGSYCDPAPWVASHVISVERALEMMTIEPAYAVSMEDYIGSLEVGKYADLVILSDNPLSIDPNDLKDLVVYMTMVEGEVEYCRPGQEIYCPAAAPSTPTSPQITAVKMNCDQNTASPPHVSSSDFIQTYFTWAAMTSDQLNEYVAAVRHAIMVDGVSIQSNITHGEFAPLEGRDLVSVSSFFDLGLLDPGEHEIRTSLTFDHQITDGFDWFGPGTAVTSLEGICTVISDP